MPVNTLAEISGEPAPRIHRPATATCAVRSYLDTAVVHFMTLPGTTEEIRERITGKSTDSRVVFDTVRANDSWLVSLHQATPNDLQRFDEFQREFTDTSHQPTLSRFDVSYDFEPKENESLASGRAWLESGITIRGRNAQPTIDYLDTFYTGDFRSAVLAAIYSDALGKLSGEPCVHIDLRFQSARTVKRLGYHFVGSLDMIDPFELWDRHVLMVSNPTSHLVRDISAFCNSADALYPMSGHLPPNERARDYIERFEIYRAQTLKDMHPRAFEALDLIPTSVLGIPRLLEWGAVKRHKRHRKTILYQD